MSVSVSVSVSVCVCVVIEVGCSFDLYLDICYLSKLLKYQPLVEAIHQLDYHCKLMTLVFGSLGHVHKNVIKYQPLLNTIPEVGYQGRLLVFIFGSF